MMDQECFASPYLRLLLIQMSEVFDSLNEQLPQAFREITLYACHMPEKKKGAG